VGLGVASGFGAKELLVIVSERAQRLTRDTKSIAREEAHQVAQVQAKLVAREETQQTVKSAIEEQTKSVVESTTKKVQAGEDYAEAEAVYVYAQIADALDEASRHKILEAGQVRAEEGLRTALPHSSARLRVAAALIQKRLAVLKGVSEPERIQRLDKAIELCTQAIEFEPKLQQAYYNRACYRALRGHDATVVAEDLKRAIELYPEYASRFPKDDDLSA
jgi:tetratricopeptide (TPR) repeat protein